MTRDVLLSEINLILLNISFSLGLLGCAKKSSGNIFFVGTLYFIYLKKNVNYYDNNYCCLLKLDVFVLVEYFFFV